MFRILLARIPAIATLLLTVWLELGCGGGLTVAGVGTGGTGNSADSGGVTFGVTSGFGSIIVDGTRYDDSQAAYLSEEDQGIARSMASTGAMLGQSVEFAYDANHAIASVLVSPELVGPVSATSPNAITVLGVRVTFNRDTTLGPVTAVVGYASPAAIQIGDRVAVYGLLKTDQTGAWYVQASLVAQKHAGTGIRLSGYVAQYNPAAGSFSLSGNTVRIGSAVISPASASLANGAAVTVWSEVTPNGNEIAAAQIRVKGPTAGDTMTVSGSISNFINAATFKVRNLTVDAAAASIAPAGSALADSQYVIVMGKFDPGANKLIATRVTVYAPAADNAVELHGTVLNFVSPTSFTVRGVVVDASAASVTGATGAQLANGVFVEVRGAVVNNSVRASAIAVRALTPAQAPTGATLDLSGTISSYNAASGTYTIVMASGATLNAILDGMTSYNDGNATDLGMGQTVTVRGMMSNGILTTSVVSFTPATAPIGSGGTPGIVTSYMEGVAYNVTAASFMLNGLTIQKNGVTVQGTGMMGAQGMMSGSRVGVTVQFSNGQYSALSITLLNG